MFTELYNKDEYDLCILRREYEGAVVLYNDIKYLLYKVNASGKSQMLCIDYSKYIGTPFPKNVTVLYKLLRVYFNGHFYILTNSKKILSCRTGNIVYKSNDNKRRDLLSLFNQESKYQERHK